MTIVPLKNFLFCFYWGEKDFFFAILFNILMLSLIFVFIIEYFSNEVKASCLMCVCIRWEEKIYRKIFKFIQPSRMIIINKPNDSIEWKKKPVNGRSFDRVCVKNPSFILIVTPIQDPCYWKRYFYFFYFFFFGCCCCRHFSLFLLLCCWIQWCLLNKFEFFFAISLFWLCMCMNASEFEKIK